MICKQFRGRFLLKKILIMYFVIFSVYHLSQVLATENKQSWTYLMIGIYFSPDHACMQTIV